MPSSAGSVLHGVNPNLKTYYIRVNPFVPEWTYVEVVLVT